jgi:hypothetical protein
MATLRISAVGGVVAVGMDWGVDVSCLLDGFGISTNAMLGGVGVAAFAQLVKISAQSIAITACRISPTLCLSFKLYIHVNR